MRNDIALGTLMLTLLGACATGGHPPDNGSARYEVEVIAPSERQSALVVGGHLQGKLEEAQVQEIVAHHEESTGACYDREEILAPSRPKLSSYDFQLRISPYGTQHQVALVHATRPGLIALETCIEESLRQIRFPRYQGEPLAVLVTIRPPERVD